MMSTTAFQNVRILTLASVAALMPALGSTAPLQDSLEQDFRHPPTDAQCWVYWMWLRTPTTPAAMTRDLEEMKAKGIAGFILYDCGANDGTPLPLMRPWSPEWRKDIRYVAREAHRLGLKFCLTVGMSGCTAPGLDPQYSDQELKWTSQEVTGPMKFEGVLTLPDKSHASNADGSPMFWDLRVLAIPVGNPIPLAEIQDLSAKMDQSGKLTWEVPAGRWRILRFVQRPINKVEGWSAHCGTYCDVLCTAGIEQDWALTMDPLLKEMTPDERAGLVALEDDSYEGGGGKWTRTFPREFQKRRGYDLLKYLPALAGETISDANTTACVRRDYRQTVTDMVSDNYYGRLQELCHQNGLAFYGEANWPEYGVNGYQWTVRKVDLLMAEFWLPAPQSLNPRDSFSREAATANHLYGKKITMSEAFTVVGPLWEETPSSLKPWVDLAYCDGINRVCIHNYSHSPSLDARPGCVYYAGTHINRNITWWDESPAFFRYMERCQALLQHGTFAADALWLAGDELVGAWQTRGQELPGYDYDRISNDNLIELTSVRDGCIVTPSGMKYRVLIMPSSRKMTLRALEKIEALAEAGATIIGPRPATMTGLPLHQADEDQYNERSAKLWGDASTKTSEINVGRGRVIPAQSPEQVLREMGLGPDFEYAGLSAQARVSWIHRHSDAADWYFLACRGVAPEGLTCKFRITGRQPELWDPVTGEMRDATAFRQENGQTVVPLEFNPGESVFVVFRKPIDPKAAGATASNYPTMQRIAKLDGPWSVAFDPKWGGPTGSVTLDTLADWSTRPEEGIKYYSGAAVYSRTFDVPALPALRQRLVLDLGEVREIASVKLNGQDLGVIWMHPARVDVTDALKPSGNQLEIKVVNLWPNRLIGDEFLPREKRFTDTNIRRFTRKSPLLPSGLLGPVTIQSSERPPAR